MWTAEQMFGDVRQYRNMYNMAQLTSVATNISIRYGELPNLKRGEIESMQTIKTSQNNFKVFIYDCRRGKIDLKQISNDCAKSAIG